MDPLHEHERGCCGNEQHSGVAHELTIGQDVERDCHREADANADRELSRRARKSLKRYVRGRTGDVVPRLSPGGLARLQRHTADVLPGHAHVTQRLRHPHLGREVSAERELSHRSEPLLIRHVSHEGLAVRSR